MQDIADWRKRIDDIDRELLGLLNDRAKCAIAIGEIKKEAGLAVYDAARERAILDRLRSLNGGPLSGDAIERLFACLIEESRRIEDEM